MTKIEFIDKINDILVGLNTLESDLLGSLYDELMRDAGWHPASELPPVNKNLISELVLCWCVDSTFGTLEPKLGRVWRGEWGTKDVKWWCYPPEKEE